MRTDQLLLSVVVATYNVADYIAECLDSILEQTFQEFELICIDDGSSDKTVSIIESYAQRDQRLRLISNPKNQGLAVIRNQSIGEAKGKYILMLDGDDLYDPTYFEKAVRLAEAENSDLVICDYAIFYSNDQIEDRKSEPSKLGNLDLENKIELLRLNAFTWIKLMKLDTMKRLGIKFPPGYTRQDIPVHWHLMTSPIRISLLPERLAFYRQQPAATTARSDKRLFHLAFIFDVVEEYLFENDLYESYKQEFLRQRLNTLHGMYDKVDEEHKEEALRLIEERLSETHYVYIRSGGELRRSARYFFLALEGDSLSKLKLGIWKTMRSLYRKIKK